MTRKKPAQSQTEETESKPFSRKDFINSVIKKKVKNKRGLQRIVGVFKSMISVKSGEVGTPKGFNKESAIKKIESILESKVSFKDYIKEERC